MINRVSSFFPNSISQSPSYVRGSTDSQSSPVIQPSKTLSANVENTFSFADKLQQFFSLSPSDFSSVFSDVRTGFSARSFPQLVSAAYTNSNLLTGKKLSLTT